MPAALTSHDAGDTPGLWATIAVVVLTGLTLILSFLSWRSGRVKRRLICSILTQTRLIAEHSMVGKKLTVIYDDKTSLVNPHVVTLEIANTGTAPIPRKYFDKNRSVIFETATSILEILGVIHKPLATPEPKISFSKNRVELQPEIIAKDERIEVSLLTEGPLEELSLVQNPFPDVEIETRDQGIWQKQRYRRRRRIVVATATASGIAAILTLTLSNIAVRSAYASRYDGTDPVASGCVSSAVPDGSNAPLRGPSGEQVGYVQLIYSYTCETIWARVVLNSLSAKMLAGDIIQINMVRPVDHARAPFAVFLPAGVSVAYGNMLSDASSCVIAKVTISENSAKKTGPETVTACR